MPLLHQDPIHSLYNSGVLNTLTRLGFYGRSLGGQMSLQML
jgi:hypothetical protein